MKTEGRKKTVLLFIVSLAAILAVFLGGVFRTRAYNRTKHRMTTTGEELFTTAIDNSKPVSINAVPRGSTWSKAFDLNNEGLTEHNFQKRKVGFVENGSWAPQAATLMEEAFDEMKQMTVLNEQVSVLSAVNTTTEKELDALADSIIESMKQSY